MRRHGRRLSWMQILAVALAPAMLACASAEAADAYEPDNSPGQARPIATDGTPQTHEIRPASDVDYVRFSAVAETEYIIETSPTASGDVGDTVVTLFGPNGVTVLAEDDDGGEGLYSRLAYTVTSSGTHYARVRSYAASHTGGYRISVRAVQSAEIRGTVTRGGQPAAGVAVWAGRFGTGLDRPAGIAITEADGSYRLTVEAGSYVVSAHLAGTVATPAERQVTVPGAGACDFSLSAAAPPPGDGVETCRAVLVGIADYAGSGMDLDYCDEDALDFAAALAAGGNWRAQNIAVIVNRDATRDAIWGALQRMATLSDADDLCLFFFSGHGSREPDLPPLDEADGQDEVLVVTDGENNIRDDELGEWVTDLPTRKFMAVIASCYSGGMIKSAGVKGIGEPGPAAVADGLADDLWRAINRRRQMSPLDLDDNGFGVVITAADDDETCQESSELEHDVLVYYLLQGMTGAADSGGDGWISAEEIYAYASPRATAFNPGQHAQLYDALPGTPFNFLDLGPAPPRSVTITSGPSGEPSIVLPGGEVACAVSAADSLGGRVGYAWSATAGSFDDAASRTPTWTAPGDDAGGELTVTISVTAASLEEPGVSDADSFTVTVLPRQQGDVRITHGPSAAPGAIAPGETTQCSVTADDGPGAGLCYQWQARDGAGNLVGGFDDASAREPTWTAPSGAGGIYAISVRVSSLADADQADAGIVGVPVAGRVEHSFDPGVAMVAIPGEAVGRTLGQVLGASLVAGWDAAAQEYSAADPPAVAGAGCWARFAAATNASVVCEPWGGESFSWELESGWNIVGLPWNVAAPLAGLSTFPAGASPRLAWTHTGAGYELISGLGAPAGAGSELRPWRAYWLYARDDCTATLSRSAVAAADDPPGWAIRVVARTASSCDASGLCGVSESGVRVPELPAAAGAPELSFEGAGGDLLAVDLRAEAAGGYEWPIRVSAAAGEEVTVLCPDLSGVPPGMRVVLEDRDAGAAVSLRTCAGYHFTAGESPRRLVLRVRPGGATLGLTGVTAQQVAAGASVSFTLSAPAEVSVAVLNIAGRVVRRLAGGRPCAEGAQTLAWDLRSDGGSIVPAGRYLVRVTARSDEGEAAAAIAALSVRR